MTPIYGPHKELELLVAQRRLTTEQYEEVRQFASAKKYAVDYPESPNLTDSSWMHLLIHGDHPMAVAQDIVRCLRDGGHPLDVALHDAACCKLEEWKRSEWFRFILSLGADPKTSPEDCIDYPFTEEMRYQLNARAKKVYPSRPNARRVQDIAAATDLKQLERVPELQYALIGQDVALQFTVENILAWAFKLKTRPKPLVLIFCGPSGHGKTELSRKICSLLTVDESDYCHMDLAQLKNCSEIMGLSGPYQGAKEGSKLNNFIVAHDKKLGVVLLDEVEKAEKGVLEALLNVFDKGEWTNKQLVSGAAGQTRTVDCSRILFMLTTNAFDGIIKKFEENNKDVHDIPAPPGLNQRLDRILKPAMGQQFSPSVAGRISGFIPFFPFTPEEVDVLIASEVQKERLYLRKKEINKHASLYVTIAQQEILHLASLLRESYIPDEGARSIRRIVEKNMTDNVIRAFIKDSTDEDALEFALSVDLDRQIVVLHDARDSPSTAPSSPSACSVKLEW
eukprot:GEMP01011777.1.p1 GENE.GEMP01011777.1~~GEMP01011777.1.p1  ORF type:complete len:508 (+),score=122.62 GEMP01011777.1:52-1575(+)